MHYIIFFRIRFFGYGSALTFKSITDADIEGVEYYVKNELLTDSKLQYHIDEAADDDFLALFFGPFVNDKKRFKFYFGEKKLIRELVTHTKNVVDYPNINDGLAHFAQKMSAKKMATFRTSMHRFQSICCFVGQRVVSANSGQLSSGHDKKIEIEHSQSENSININEQKSLILKKALVSIQNFEKKHKVKRSREFVSDFIIVNGSNYDDVKASVQCCFCDETISNSKIKLYLKRSTVGGNWVMSNLVKHFSIHHGSVNNLENKSSMLALKVEPYTSNEQIVKPILNAERIPSITDSADQLSTHMSIQCIKMVNATLLNNEPAVYLKFEGADMKKTKFAILLLMGIAYLLLSLIS